jgi:hypothetical protein
MLLYENWVATLQTEKIVEKNYLCLFLLMKVPTSNGDKTNKLEHHGYAGEVW